MIYWRQNLDTVKGQQRMHTEIIHLVHLTPYPYNDLEWGGEKHTEEAQS